MNDSQPTPDNKNAAENPNPADNLDPEAKEKPEIKKKRKFSAFEPVSGIILAVVATVIFFFFPNIIAVVFVDGPLIPTFVDTVIGNLWFPIFLWGILRIGVEVFYLIERRYTKRLAVTTIIGNVIAFVCTLFIFIPYKIVNVDYIDWIHTYFRGGAAWFGEILARPNLIIIFIMLIGLLLDSITVISKGRKEKELEEKEDKEEEKALKEGDTADAV